MNKDKIKEIEALLNCYGNNHSRAIAVYKAGYRQTAKNELVIVQVQKKTVELLWLAQLSYLKTKDDFYANTIKDLSETLSKQTGRKIFPSTFRALLNVCDKLEVEFAFDTYIELLKTINIKVI